MILVLHMVTSAIRVDEHARRGDLGAPSIARVVGLLPSLLLLYLLHYHALAGAAARRGSPRGAVTCTASAKAARQILD